jgi:uncharacterized membrane protein YkoI
MPSSPSSASSGSGSPSPKPITKKKCLSMRNKVWKKSRHVKRSPDHKAYDVRGHCARQKTAWMILLAYTKKVAGGRITYTEIMELAGDEYKKYKKTHMAKDGKVKISHTELKAIARRIVGA